MSLYIQYKNKFNINEDKNAATFYLWCKVQELSLVLLTI